MRVAHNVPPNDIEPHRLNNCPCNPVIEIIEPANVAIFWHRSLFGIRYVEAIEVSMGMRCAGCKQFLDEKGEHIPEPPPYNEY